MGLQVCSIVNESSIDKAISIALKNASIIGFDKLNCNLIISAVSEIATNIIRYAGEGKMLVEVSENKRGIQITFSDKGSGIDNIDEVMIDGHTSSKSSLGVGLGATKRVMDSFKIESNTPCTSVALETSILTAEALTPLTLNSAALYSAPS